MQEKWLKCLEKTNALLQLTIKNLGSTTRMNLAHALNIQYEFI